MQRRSFVITLLLAIFVTSLAVTFDAHARVGGGRSSGSRGSRSYSPPSRSYSQPAPVPGSNYSRPYQQPYQQPQSGGFFRSMAGGLLGGVLGGMLFRGLGFAGGGMGGSGIGLFEILLIAGIGWMIWRMVKKKRDESAYQAGGMQYGSYDQPRPQTFDIPPAAAAPAGGDVQSGLSHIRSMDSGFTEEKFRDQAMDAFFRIQAAYGNRDISSVTAMLTDEMRHIIQSDIDDLKRQGRINRLENIAVRNVEIIEAWQESGQDYLTVLMTANLLDYTTDEAGTVISGSKTEPVKFEEYWTFTRNVGANGWKLSAIQQP